MLNWGLRDVCALQNHDFPIHFRLFPGEWQTHVTPKKVNESPETRQVRVKVQDGYTRQDLDSFNFTKDGAPEDKQGLYQSLTPNTTCLGSSPETLTHLFWKSHETEEQ